MQRLVEVNLLGCLWGMRAAMAAFDPRGGDVVNIASLSGLGPVPGYAVYAATKAAVVSVTMSVSAEVPAGVRVHALCPDGVQTAMLDAQDHEAVGSQLVHSGGRILTVDETADAAVALLGTRRVVRSLPGWRGGPDAVGRTRAVGREVRHLPVRGARCPGDRPARRRAVSQDRFSSTESVLLTAGRRRGSAGGIATRRKSFEHLFVSLLETVRTPALPSYMCSIERLIGPPPGPTVGGHH